MPNFVGGSIVAKILRQEGVDTVFTITGEHTQSIYYRCVEEGITVVDCRHECGAALAAEGYAKASGKPGVVIATAGPGVSNTFTGVVEAAVNGSPVVLIGGAAPLAETGSGTLQDYDLLTPYKSVVKWAERVYQTAGIPEKLTTAFRQSTAGVPGPVYLEIPFDVMQGAVDERDLAVPEFTRTANQPFGDPEAIEQAAALLVQAQKPAMVIGDTARYFTKHGDAVAELADYLQIPVMTTNLAKGLFASEDNPIFQLGRLAVSRADVILELNVKNDIGVFMARTFQANARKVQVHPDASLIGMNTAAHIGIVGGAGPVAQQLLQAVKRKTEKRGDTAWIHELGQARRQKSGALMQAAASANTPVEPARVAGCVAEFMAAEGRDWTLVVDGGDISSWTMAVASAHRPGQVITGGSFAPVGIGVPLALGSWFAVKKPVLLVSGDGSFGYYPMEFVNFVKHRIPAIMIISNDSCWGMIKSIQRLHSPEIIEQFDKEHKFGYACNTPEIAYEKIAEMFGGHGEFVDDPEQVLPAIRRAAASGRPAIVNVRTAEPSTAIVSPGAAFLVKMTAHYQVGER